MANTNIGISNFVTSQSPFFVRNDHPNFIRFIEAYYEYLEQEGKTIQRAKEFRQALDVDNSIDLYTEKLYSQFLSLLPDKTIADKNLLVKHIKDFYRAKGTEKSIEFLLSILYDLETDFYYPKKDILKASDGKWYQEKSLKVFDIQVNNVADSGVFTAKNFSGREVRGASSNATATVESVDVYYENGVVVKELKVSNQVRDFVAGEKIYAQFEEEGLIKFISANVFSGIIVRVDIENRGNNYSVSQEAKIESANGSGAIVVISEVSQAAIKSISALDGGAGFQNTNLILATSTSGTGANAYISLVNTDESIHPNTYNIVMSLISQSANSLIGGFPSNTYETFAYQNLAPVLVTVPPNTSNLIANTISGTSVGKLYFDQPIANSNVYFKTGDSLNVYNVLTNSNYVIYISSNTVNTTNIQFSPEIGGNLTFERVTVLTAPFSAYSNLTISTGSGTGITTINLSSSKANSNVFFETYDNIYCYGTNVTILSSNTVTNQLIVSLPGLPGPLTNEPFQVIKKPNYQSVLANSMIYFTYANTGPIQRIVVLAGGNNYTGNTTLTGVANTRIKNLGILGKMRVVHGGSGYAINEEIEFINKPYATIGAGTGARGYIASVNGTGAIETVKFKEVPGHYIGGSGYNMLELPTANIITTSGVGGNVAVVATLGEGEKLNTITDDIGAILRLDIISGGSGYKVPPTINLRHIGSGTAQAKATIVEGVFTYPGRYLNDDGHLSSYNFLQDGKYYHNYSYVVKIKQAINNYRKALKDLAHPAGMSLFGEYSEVDNSLDKNVSVTTVRTTGNTVLKRSAFYTYSTPATYNVSGVLGSSNNVIVTANGHGLYSNDVIRIDFRTGDLPNVPNSTYVINVLSSNTFNINVGKYPNANGTANVWLNYMTVYRQDHGFGVGNTLYFEVLDSTTPNVVNGILTIVSVANSNTYNAVHTTIASSNGYNSGNGYIGFAY